MNSMPSTNSFSHKNPEQKPLEDLQIEIKNVGVTKTIPALDKFWAEKRYFLTYEAPNLVHENGNVIIGAKERWLELTNLILDDLNWLLRLPFYKFWSNIIHNPSIVDSIIIFLQEAPTPYTKDNFPNDQELREQFDKLRQKILIVFARLVSNKESPYEYISSRKFANLLYNKYIITIPILMDLCQQYGRDNRKVIEIIIISVFTMQTNYEEDLEKTVIFMVEALQNIEKRFEDCPINQQGKAVPLSERGGANVEISLIDLEDLILYLIDTVSTVHIFIDIYSPAIKHFQTDHFLEKLITVYNHTIPEMYKRLVSLSLALEDKIEKYYYLKHFLDVTRTEFLQVFRKIIHYSIQKVVDNKNNDISQTEREKIVDDYLNCLSLTLCEPEFIKDYCNLYPIGDDLETLLEVYPELNTVKSEFILESIYRVINESNVEEVGANVPTSSVVQIEFKSLGMFQRDENTKSTESTNEVIQSEASNASCESNINISPLIVKVKEIFSDLGEGFIERCLKHYNYKTESVINALLEDLLPEELKALDRSLPIIPPDPEEALATSDAIIGAQRLNVFDNDEFDIMTKDVMDTSRIHKGKKKDEYKNIHDLLNDKTHLTTTKDLIINKYSIVTDYEDEYDDTYDEVDISTAQDDVEIDGRPFTTPRVFCKPKYDIECEEENGFYDTTQSNKDHFVQDPAVLRAKAEERRYSSQGFKAARPQNSVVGNPKGQGQSKETLNSRTYKNKNKASKANHNRRNGAQYKRNQGMLPS